ncbi:hypothetical protein [Aurantimonas sp. 22II-16-19i]|uniref:hypothetical protein n=1 Tax=Aurantimonas sp. 22II-16-19i TaxID=1317114 RepID=UPI0009F7E8E9|nr:hypothetical protein [Aurantimonas sp. 22II-16-19i]ORE98702.1 hypothetical protein ATO4_00010 [Aurantimonas sp. 22II-16-19i]
MSDFEGNDGSNSDRKGAAIPKQTTDHGKIEETREELEKQGRPEDRDLTTDHELASDAEDERPAVDGQTSVPVRTD